MEFKRERPDLSLILTLRGDEIHFNNFRACNGRHGQPDRLTTISSRDSLPLESTKMAIFAFHSTLRYTLSQVTSPLQVYSVDCGYLDRLAQAELAD